MIYYLVVGAIFYVLYKLFLTSDPPPIFGVYTQPGKWFTLKYWIFRLVFKYRKMQNERKSEVPGSGSEGAGYGMRSRSTVADMEKVQDLPKEHPKAVDAVYINGGDKDGRYVVGATARRHNGIVQTLLVVRIPGVGLFELPSQPDTWLHTDKLAFTAGGLTLESVEAMKTWKMKFQGKTRLTKPDGKTELVDMNFDLDWTAYSPYFDFDTDLDVHAMSMAIAREPWNRQFFDNLKLAHQTHYEQFGELVGTIHTSTHGDFDIKIQGVRDHSYGNVREWRDLHRYAIQYIHMEDGTTVCVGNICMRPTMTRLIIGYVMHPGGGMDTVSWTDLELHTLAEDGHDPNDFSFNFKAGGKSYHLEGQVQQCAIFYMDPDWEARIHERLCRYKINGVPGWGISEWDYRYHGGKGNIFQRANHPKQA